MSLSRRRFLAGAAAAVGAPMIVPASALASGPSAPSNRIALACIGVANMGGSHVSGFLQLDDAQIVAVCDVDRNIREARKAQVEASYARRRRGEYKGCAAYNDFRDVLARRDIDALCIATPDHWHAPIVIEAARAGKDMYCEKPLSLTIREGREMVKAVRRYDCVLQTGTQRRSHFNGRFRLACELVRSGRIGKVLTVHTGVGGPPIDCYLPAEPVPEALDWEMWLGPAPWRAYNSGLHPYSWRPYRDYSGGNMTNTGAHFFDIAQWGLGMDESGPVEIIPPNGRDVKVLTYRYANGALLYDRGAREVIFTGTDGKIEVDTNEIKAWPEDILKEPLGPNDVHLYRSPGHREDFLNCVRERRRPACDVEIGHRSTTVSHLGNIAYHLKRPLRWDPAKEEFIGDDEANRMCDRPRRAPWRL
ncbi:MAG: Gfo/Idh/MocA family oxidoreductase [Planctomycetota bacterium]